MAQRILTLKLFGSDILLRGYKKYIIGKNNISKKFSQL